MRLVGSRKVQYRLPIQLTIVAAVTATTTAPNAEITHRSGPAFPIFNMKRACASRPGETSALVGSARLLSRLRASGRERGTG